MNDKSTCDKKDKGVTEEVTPGKKFTLKELSEIFHDIESTTVKILGASLVAQRLRICLPMQGTRVRALVLKDPTCRGATRPVSHNY